MYQKSCQFVIANSCQENFSCQLSKVIVTVYTVLLNVRLKLASTRLYANIFIYEVCQILLVTWLCSCIHLRSLIPKVLANVARFTNMIQKQNENILKTNEFGIHVLKKVVWAKELCPRKKTPGSSSLFLFLAHDEHYIN